MKLYFFRFLRAVKYTLVGVLMFNSSFYIVNKLDFKQFLTINTIFLLIVFAITIYERHFAGNHYSLGVMPNQHLSIFKNSKRLRLVSDVIGFSTILITLYYFVPMIFMRLGI